MRSQEKLPFQLEMIPSLGVGKTLNLKDGLIADDLIRQDEIYSYLESFSSQLIFDNNWGILFTLRNQFIESYNIYLSGFEYAVYERLDGDFFRSPSTLRKNKASKFWSSVDLSVGVTRRINTANFRFYPSLSIGLTGTELISYSSRLKQRNSNTVINYSLLSNSYSDSESDVHYSFTLNPGIRLAYPICKNIFVQTALQYQYRRLDIGYREVILNIYTNEEKTMDLNYNKNIHSVNLGFGLLLEY